MKYINATVSFELAKEMHRDADLHNRRYAITAVNSDYQKGIGAVTFREIKSTEF